MSDSVLTTLIVAVSSILTALIMAYVQLQSIKTNSGPKPKQDDTEAKGKKGEKDKKKSEPSERKDRLEVLDSAAPAPKISWRRPILAAIVAGVVILLIRTQWARSTAEPSELTASLSDATVEFVILDHAGSQVKVPAYGTLALREGDRITVETRLFDAQGYSYPNQLDFTYFFTPNRDFSGKVAPYTANKPKDTITVRIRDLLTGEEIKRFLFIEATQ